MPNNWIKTADGKKRVKAIFDERYAKVAAHTDYIFVYLLFFQWALAVIFALTLSPTTWVGEESVVHIHLYAAVFLGFVLSCFPYALVRRSPGLRVNRIVISVAQIMYSILLIHLTGGRIETHFHIFGSLAFLAFYRDWWTIIIATAVTAADHFLRGAFWPQSVYGVLQSTPWRAVEHAAWVVFEDIILFASIRLALAELREVSETQAMVEHSLASVESEVELRTAELRLSQAETERQQALLVQSAKLSSLGEMAGGVAHEINNPVATIRLKASQLRRLIESDRMQKEQGIEFTQTIEDTTVRISRIVDGLRTFARDGNSDIFSAVSVSKIIADTRGLCEERLKSNGVRFDSSYPENQTVECKAVQIEQILVNLINNAYDAIASLNSPWIRLEAKAENNFLHLSVTDSGNGIPKSVAEKIMQPFFTTKAVGKGTGLGLSISHGIAKAHGGELKLNSECANTQFVLRIPLKQNQQLKTVA